MRYVRWSEVLFQRFCLRGFWNRSSELISRSLLINDKYVFVANKDDKISKAYVQPLFYNKKNVIVTGLENGTRLITSNVSGIYEGMKIKVVQK